MLTDIQNKLLQMMKELDELCRENGIHYTLGGGSAIGAIRHRGFLPWDDDIDLYMTRDNWEKFKALGQDNKLPPHRVIEAPETDASYTNTIGRYVTTDSSSIHSHQIIYDDPAGHVLDVFIFDPIHIDNYRQYFEDLMLLSDLMDETKGYSSRFDMNLKRYPAALKRAEAGGKEEVIREIMERLTHADEPGRKHYIMEWGVAPFLFPASIFDGGYVRVPFEDTTLEIVRNFYEYLVWQYGDDWQYIPEHQGREGHDAIFSNTLPYDRVRSDYMPFIDKDKVRAAYLRRKKRLLFANPYRRRSEKSARAELAAKAGARVMKSLAVRALKGEDCDLEKMLEEHRFYDIADIFEAYYRLQLGPEFAGRRDKHSTLRSYHYPTLIPMDTRMIEIAAEALMRTERMAKAKRLLDIASGRFEEDFRGTADDYAAGIFRYSHRMSELNEEIMAARLLLNEESVLTYKAVYEDADAAAEELDRLYARVCDFLSKYELNSYIWRLKMRLLIKQRRDGREVRRELREALDILKELCPERSPASGEVSKYKADIAEAKPEEYRRIAAATTNGWILLAIGDILAEHGMALAAEEEEPGAETPAAAAAPVSAGNENLQKKLYRYAREAYRTVAGRDDRLKDGAWDIACRTRDRVYLIDRYRDRLDELEALKTEGELDKLAEELKPHEEAVLRNLSLGLGLCVHPILSELQYEIFRSDGREELIEQIEALIPEQHRQPVS